LQILKTVLFISIFLSSNAQARSQQCQAIFYEESLTHFWVHVSARDIHVTDLDLPGLFTIRVTLRGHTYFLPGYFSGENGYRNEDWFLQRRYPLDPELSRYRFRGHIEKDEQGELHVHITRISPNPLN
jgi:hypothetical protein